MGDIAGALIPVFQLCVGAAIMLSALAGHWVTPGARRIRSRSRALWLLSLVCCASPAFSQHHAQATSPVLDTDQSLAISQGVIGTTPGNYRLVNQDRKPVSLHDYRGKPLVVNFIYTSCYHTCPVMTAHLKDIVKIAREAVGADSFAVASLGFDANVDTPERIRLFAVQRGVDFNGWDFVTADAETIQGLTRELGFVFAPSPNGFDHLAQTTILDAEGKVYRQVYGAAFETTALVEPLKELVFDRHDSEGKFSQWIEGIKLWCTVYDPSTNRYYFDYSIFYGIVISLLCLAAVTVFIIRAWRENGIHTPAGKV
jgi:protein SCO1/2